MPEGQRRKGQKLPIKKKSDLSADLFLAFGMSFRFLSQVYLEVPDNKFMEKIFRNNLFFDWPVAENQKTVSKGLKILRDYSSQWQPEFTEALKRDYTRLFIGLEKILAPPYASVYLSEDHLLYEKPFLDVRRFYEKLDLSVNPMNREPDDHIGFELYCLSFLCQNAANAAEEHDIKKFHGYQTALREFLSEHLNTWLDSFLSQVKDKAQASFYRGVAFLTLGLVESLSGCLDIDEETR
jgi:TorA maturation chaperone TorD